MFYKFITIEQKERYCIVEAKDYTEAKQKARDLDIEDDWFDTGTDYMNYVVEGEDEQDVEDLFADDGKEIDDLYD